MVSYQEKVGERSLSNCFKALSAIILAMQMIILYCKKLKFIRKIVLVTNGNGAMSDDGIDGVIQKLKEDGIELVVMFVFSLSHWICMYGVF